MRTQLKQAEDIMYRPVYLLNLKPVINLYLQQDAFQTNEKNTPVLTEYFGLPLYTVESAKKIIACSFVLLNTSGEIIFRVLVDKEYSAHNIENGLMAFTKDNYMNKENSLDRQGLKNLIYKLVDWLNWCR